MVYVNRQRLYLKKIPRSISVPYWIQIPTTVSILYSTCRTMQTYYSEKLVPLLSAILCTSLQYKTADLNLQAPTPQELQFHTAVFVSWVGTWKLTVPYRDHTVFQWLFSHKFYNLLWYCFSLSCQLKLTSRPLHDEKFVHDNNVCRHGNVLHALSKKNCKISTYFTSRPNGSERGLTTNKENCFHCTLVNEWMHGTISTSLDSLDIIL